MKKVKLGIIGLGNMGSGHIKNYMVGMMPEIEVTAIADVKPSRIAATLETLKSTEVQTYGKAGSELKVDVEALSKINVETYASGDALIEAGTVDAVLIAVPHYFHPTLAIKALEAGINVMCEKPAGVYVKQVEEMNAVAEKSGKTFAMMFNQRTNCVYRKMKEMIDSGELGEIRRVNWIITDWFRTQEYYDSGAWRATWAGEGGGVLMNQCPHQLDLLQWICGLPTKVYTKMYEGKWHDIEVEDDVTTFMEFANGATGVFITSTGDTPGTNRFEVTLDGGKIIAEKDSLKLYKLKDTTVSKAIKESKQGMARIPGEWIDVETDGRNIQHPEVLNHFAANILRGEPLVANGVEGINGVKLSNAMHYSSWTNSTVELPVDPDKYYAMLMEKCKTSRHKEEVDVVLDTEGSY